MRCLAPTLYNHWNVNEVTGYLCTGSVPVHGVVRIEVCKEAAQEWGHKVGAKQPSKEREPSALPPVEEELEITGESWPQIQGELPEAICLLSDARISCWLDAQGVKVGHPKVQELATIHLLRQQKLLRLGRNFRNSQFRGIHMYSHNFTHTRDKQVDLV